MNYQEFLQKKAIVHQGSGIAVERGAIHPMLFDFQKDLVQWGLRKGRAAVFADCGLGKCHKIDTTIIMYDGTIKMVQDIEVGDLLMGHDSKPRTVLNTNQGYGELYQVTPIKGEPFVCNADHILSLRCSSTRWPNSKHQKGNTINISLQDYQKQGMLFKGLYRLWRPDIIHFPQKPRLKYHPYLIGLWIADGTVGISDMTTCDDDIEIFAFLKKISEEYGLEFNRYRNSSNSSKVSLTTARGYKNPFRDFVNEECYRDGEKRIPHDYLVSSKANRLELLAALIDGDGYHIAKCYEIATKYKGLASDIAFLARSLGFGVTQKTVTKGIKSTGFSGEYEKLVIYGETSDIPCKLPRKQAEPRKQIKNVRNVGFSVDPVGNGDYYGFTLDGDGLYLLGDFTVTHNSFIQLEYARLTKEKTLIVAPLSVARQTVQEGKKLGVDVHYTRSDADLIDGINITNFEMVQKFNSDKFSCVVIDESSILKSLSSATRKVLTEMFESTPFRLCCTATPAPNDIAELANHAEFLGVLTRREMLSMFFVNQYQKKQEEGKALGKVGWRLKRHAEKSFYQWLASWGMSIRKPSDFGYDDNGFILPPLSVEPRFIDTDFVPDGFLFPTTLGGIQGRSEARKSTLEERCQAVVDMVNADDKQWICWCGLNDESKYVTDGIPDAIEVKGSDKPEKKEQALFDFQDGKYRVLVTKVSIAGFGMNFQNCHKMAFVGLSDSAEQYYQAIRRCYRFGQSMPVEAHIVLSEIEKPIYDNVLQKERMAKKMSTELIANVQAFEVEEIKSNIKQSVEYKTGKMTGDDWELWLGDSCELMKDIPDNSIHHSVFSPPFQSLFVYSNTERDLSNSKMGEHFFEHFGYIIRELYRVMMPGRMIAVHCMPLPLTKNTHGYMGVHDFPGDIIRAFNAEGWHYQGQVVIQKNVQSQASRQKVKNLLFVQLHKDSSQSHPGMPDHVCFFRKPGENPIPVDTDVDDNTWIEWAHPVWTGIKETNVLQPREAKENNDERHICPLQLEVIERCIRLWSNKGETIFSPFAGIGSEGYVAVQHDRKFIGIELKESYYNTAIKNLKAAESKKAALTLF